MRTTTINYTIYEIGDVIEIAPKNFRLESKRRSIGGATRAVVVGVGERVDKMHSYKVVADNGKMFTLTPSEQGGERYIGHIDFGLLFDGVKDNDKSNRDQNDW